MKIEYKIAIVSLSVFGFVLLEDIDALNKNIITYSKTFTEIFYLQDTPRLDSAKHNNKNPNKLKLNKDTALKHKKDTVFSSSLRYI